MNTSTLLIPNNHQNNQQQNQNNMNNNTNNHHQQHSNTFYENNSYHQDTNFTNQEYQSAQQFYQNLQEDNHNHSMNKLEKFLLFAAGVDLNLMKKCPQSDKNLYTTIGIILIIFSLYATWNIHHAFSEMNIFNDWQAWIFAVILAFLLVNLDRFFISRFIIDPKLRVIKKIFNLYSLTRIFLATVIGIFISIPMLLQFNADVINNAIIKEQQQKVKEINNQNYTDTQTSKELDRLKKLKQDAEIKKNRLIAESDSLRKIMNKNQYKEYDEKKQKEIWKFTSTGLMAKNNLHTIQNQTLPNTEALINNLEKQILDKTQELSSKEQSTKNTIETLEKNKEFALTEKLDILFELMTTNGWLFGIWNLLLFLFFISIEVVPVLLKTLSPASQYDILQYELLQKNIIESEKRQKINQMIMEQSLKYQEHQNQMNNIINEYTLQSEKIKTDQEIQQQQHIAHLQELKQQSEYKAAEISTRAKLDEITLKTQSEIDKLKREIDIEKITFFLNNIHTYLQQLHQNHQIEKEKAQNEIEIDKIKTPTNLKKICNNTSTK